MRGRAQAHIAGMGIEVGRAAGRSIVRACATSSSEGQRTLQVASTVARVRLCSHTGLCDETGLGSAIPQAQGAVAKTTKDWSKFARRRLVLGETRSLGGSARETPACDILYQKLRSWSSVSGVKFSHTKKHPGCASALMHSLDVHNGTDLRGFAKHRRSVSGRQSWRRRSA